MWRYAHDAGAAAPLRQVARRRGLRILVAPSIVYEALRTQNDELRRGLTSLMARRAWTPLMPESFGEAEEFLAEVRRLRPRWLRHDEEKERWRKRNIVDWRRGRGTFWDRLRQNPAEVARHVAELEGGQVEGAREAAVERRRAAMNAGWKFERTTVDRVTAHFDRPMRGWDGDPVEAWRASALGAATALVDLPYSDWLSPYIDVAAHVQDPSWVRFWLHEADARHLPRWWIRGACEVLMSLRKVTPGTPCDAQLATYLFACDAFVTCDRTFAEIIEACRPAAPLPMARTVLVQLGADGFGAILQSLDLLRRTP